MEKTANLVNYFYLVIFCLFISRFQDGHNQGLDSVHKQMARSLCGCDLRHLYDVSSFSRSVRAIRIR